MIQPKVNHLSFMGARHQTNDDHALVNQEQGIYILCDGVSEGGLGNYASEMIAKSVQDELIEANLFLKKNGSQLLGPKRLQAMQDLLLKAFSHAQQSLVSTGATNPNYKLASTTCITLWMNDRFGILAHLGDSRAYLYRGGQAYQLTKDHSAYEELVKAGMSPEEAKKNPMSGALSRCFGNSRQNQPDLLKIEFQPNDTLILCTDGVYSAFQNPQMQKLLHGVLQGEDLKSFLEKCAYQSGDDSTMIQVHFPASMHQDSPIQAADRIQLIQQAPLSKYFDYVQRSHIAAICEVQEFKKGSVVIQEETEGECMYIVAKGTFEILLKGQHLTYIKAGEFVGEVGLIHQHTRRTATVVAREDGVLLSLSRTDLFEVFKKDPDMERFFYKSMLELVMGRMVDLGNQLTQLKGV